MATELIKKIAENHVLVVPVKSIETTAKQAVEVYDYDKQISYGDVKIKEDDALATTQLAYWSDEHNVADYVKAQIDKYTALKTRVTAVKAAMAGEIIKGE